MRVTTFCILAASQPAWGAKTFMQPSAAFLDVNSPVSPQALAIPAEARGWFYPGSVQATCQAKSWSSSFSCNNALIESTGTNVWHAEEDAGVELGPISFIIDLGKVYEITGWREMCSGSYPEGACLKKFTVMKGDSHEGPWLTVFEGEATNDARDKWTPGSTFTFPPANSRYFKLVLTTNHGDTSNKGNLNILNVEFYGIEDKPGKYSTAADACSYCETICPFVGDNRATNFKSGIIGEQGRLSECSKRPEHLVFPFQPFSSNTGFFERPPPVGTSCACMSHQDKYGKFTMFCGTPPGSTDYKWASYVHDQTTAMCRDETLGGEPTEIVNGPNKHVQPPPWVTVPANSSYYAVNSSNSSYYVDATPAVEPEHHFSVPDTEWPRDLNSEDEEIWSKAKQSKQLLRESVSEPPYKVMSHGEGASGKKYEFFLICGTKVFVTKFETLFAGEYTNQQLPTAKIVIDCDDSITVTSTDKGSTLYTGSLHFDNVSSKCTQPRDESATMYVKDTNGVGSYECLYQDGTSVKGSHYTGPDAFSGPVEYKLVKKKKCGPAAEFCSAFSAWPNVKNDVTCDNCTALVQGQNYGYRCDTYCESFGHVCMGAWEEEANSCTKGETFGCDSPVTKKDGNPTSDMLCHCKQRAEVEVTRIKLPPNA